MLATFWTDEEFALTPRQSEQFRIFQEKLLAANQKFNLTRITTAKGVALKHFYDSLLGLKVCAWSGAKNILDLGTGAGFPGVPLKIMSPALPLVLVDSLQKRTLFLEELREALGLTATEVKHSRAEVLGHAKAYRENFSHVVSRAVAPLAVLLEYCLPFVQCGGFFLAYKGLAGRAEVCEAQTALQELGGQIVKEEAFSLPEQQGERLIIVVEKIKPTPLLYPRRPGRPLKRPL